MPGRIHMDIGMHEGSDMRVARALPHTYIGRYILSLRRMHDLLLAKGYRAGQDINYEEEIEADHNEAAWARRLPGALRFLLS